METMLAMVAAGVGIAVAPKGLVRRQVRSVVVRMLPAKSPLSEIGLAIRSDRNDALTKRLVQLSLSQGKIKSSK